ncbi:MAG: single-stranded DNA-binding protein [Patescibacteria group bacterium]|nr:single-stranded DNA-binding protein [Patescibacteria group bacterium]
MNLNKVFLIGRLTQEVDFRYLPSGNPIAILNIATNRIYKDRTGNTREEAEYHRVVVWGKLAELCRNYLSKGRLVFVEGRIRSRSWVDTQGNRRSSYEIVAENIRFGPRSGLVETEKDLENIETELDVYKTNDSPEEFGVLDIPY